MTDTLLEEGMIGEELASLERDRIARPSAFENHRGCVSAHDVREITGTARLRSWIRGVWNRRFRLLAIRAFERVVLKRQAERFYMYLGGHIFFETLYAARKLDLFTLLDVHGPLTRHQIAEKLSIQDQPARIMLLGLTVGGLIKKRRGKYRNSLLAKQLLSRTSSRQVLSYVDFEHDIIYRPMHHLYDSIKSFSNVGLEEFPGTERTLYERLARRPELESVFQQAMQDLSVQANRDLARYVDFSKIQHVVDVGGGDGTNAIALLSEWPHLSVTVFDSPSVCDRAERNIREHGLSEQIQTFAGNCFEDEFPSTADCVLFGHFFTIWSPRKNQQLLEKCQRALPSDGKVILFNMMQNDEEDGPWGAAVGSPYFLALASGEGMLYTWREYEDWMRSAGFVDVKRYKLPRHQGIIVCRKL